MMRPTAKVRDSLPSESAPPAPPPARSFGPSGARRHLESRFAPLGPVRGAGHDDASNGLAQLRKPAAIALPSRTLLIRTAGLVVVLAAVLLVLRPVSKIARTASPANEPARIRVISSTGDSHLAAATKPKQKARVLGTAEGAANAPAPTLATERQAAATPAPDPEPAAGHALAFAPEPAQPSSPALIATVRAVPVLTPATPAPAPAAAAPTVASLPAAFPQPRPASLAAPDAASTPAAAPSSSDTAALVREARGLIARGRLSEGRDMLKRAVAAGDRHAATILAKTYDPAVLKVWHVKGATVDPAEARRWYEKAQEMGSPAAKAALDHMP